MKKIEDPIAILCERHGFNKMIRKKEDEIIKATGYLWKAFEIFYGQEPSPEDVRDLLLIVLKRPPEWTTFDLNPELNDKEIKERVIRRIAENIFTKATRKFKEWSYLDGI